MASSVEAREGMGPGMAPAQVGEVSEQLAGPGQQACVVPASRFVRGAARLQELGRGWVRPWRFLAPQVRALESCLAWYPGIYRQMAPCTAGVCLEFDTDATELALEIRVDAEPVATRNVLKGIKDPSPLPGFAYDGLTLEVDGELSQIAMPAPAQGHVQPGEWGPSLTLSLGEPRRVRTASLVQLPGFAATRRTRLWLPALRGCELGRIAVTGTSISPVTEDRKRLLVLGDSLAQGFVTQDPACAWPTVVARACNFELMNQSVGAQVFQPSSLSGAEELPEPDVCVVALGANLRYGRCNEGVVAREIGEYLTRVGRLWPSADLLVVTPAQPDAARIVRGSCAAEAPRLIREAAARVRSSRLRAGHGAVLVADAPALGEELLSDADGHPTAAGAAVFAEFVMGELEKFSCRCLRDLGVWGKCGACVRADEAAEDAGEAAGYAAGVEPAAEPACVTEVEAVPAAEPVRATDAGIEDAPEPESEPADEPISEQELAPAAEPVAEPQPAPAAEPVPVAELAPTAEPAPEPAPAAEPAPEPQAAAEEPARLFEISPARVVARSAAPEQAPVPAPKPTRPARTKKRMAAPETLMLDFGSDDAPVPAAPESAGEPPALPPDTPRPAAPATEPARRDSAPSSTPPASEAAAAGSPAKPAERLRSKTVRSARKRSGKR